MVTQCCVCKKVKITAEVWQFGSTAEAGQEISHGYCPSCAEKVWEEIEKEKEEKEAGKP
ncbi:MAG: hypothetical protein Q7K65_03420 [Candidatus Buchananbacteria bacterium]|nr:hypothetical protein [Candidatus Buchananbacteria bacterium]